MFGCLSVRAFSRLWAAFKFGSFRKLGIPYFGVIITRILLFRVLYWGPLFSETPICDSETNKTELERPRPRPRLTRARLASSSRPLGFRVSGFRVSGFQGLGFRGLGFRVHLRGMQTSLA